MGSSLKISKGPGGSRSVSPDEIRTGLSQIANTTGNPQWSTHPEMHSVGDLGNWVTGLMSGSFGGFGSIFGKRK